MKMPTHIEPMAATMTSRAFDDKNWIFEFKQDGYRLVTYCDGREVRLKTRKLKDYTTKFPEIVAAFQNWKHTAILDGEVVAINEQGKDDFHALQSHSKNKKTPILYFVFDLLWYDGKSYMDQPLLQRKKQLEKILPASPVLVYHPYISGKGIPAYKMAQQEGLEGIVAKKKDSLYQPGRRTKQWLKIKVLQDHEFIIAGYTHSQASGTTFGTLILAAHHQGTLQCFGEVGTGFSETVKRAIVEQLKPVQKCPFRSEPTLSSRWRKKRPDTITWCRPQMVCTVQYYELTPEGYLRHPVFKSLRKEVKAKEVTL